LVRIVYYGRSSFQIRGGRLKILIDPGVISGGNEPIIPEESWKDTDIILVTCPHRDYAGYVKYIGTRSYTIILGPPSLEGMLGGGDYNFHPLRGGEESYLLGSKITALKGRMSAEANKSILKLPFVSKRESSGEAIGYSIELEGRHISHLGPLSQVETPKGERPDVLIVPLGGGGMHPADAMDVVGRLNPRLVIPARYNFPSRYKVDMSEFAKMVEEEGYECRLMEAGTAIVV
jgi:L-ascorbate metabolism protein UlaG (beta-lactamase superfamily)